MTKANAENAKSEQRVAARARRDALFTSMDAAARARASRSLADGVDAHLVGARTIAAYLAIGSEIDPMVLIERLWQRGVTVALPHVAGRDRPMRFLAWAQGDVAIDAPMGVRQPAATVAEVTPDIILTPLLAFDGRLHRLGYGAGFYDRAFVANPAARRIGLAWHVQQVDRIAEDAWDVPLHSIVTETGFVEP